MGNKRKRYSLLLVGLVLILATSVVACGQPAPTPLPDQPQMSPAEVVAALKGELTRIALNPALLSSALEAPGEASYLGNGQWRVTLQGEGKFFPAEWDYWESGQQQPANPAAVSLTVVLRRLPTPAPRPQLLPRRTLDEEQRRLQAQIEGQLSQLHRDMEDLQRKLRDEAFQRQLYETYEAPRIRQEQEQREQQLRRCLSALKTGDRVWIELNCH